MKPMNYRSFIKLLIFLFLFGFFTSASFAQLNLSPLFGNGMVLQRDMVIPVWGNGTAGSSVTITIAGNSQSTIVESSGKWKVELPAMSAGGPFTMTITSGTQTLNRTDVYIGDVWLAAGQSNMEFEVSGLKEAATIRASANDQKIRQFKVPKGLANEPSNAVHGHRQRLRI
jgi:sialate O-acetylesterase